MRTFNKKMNKDDLILWTDVETNSPDPEVGELLELGVVVSDISGNKLGDEYHTLFKTDIVEVMQRTDEFVLAMHEKSGLWKDLWVMGGSTFDEVDKELGEWTDNLLLNRPTSKLYFGGNSITLDRNFLRIFLPNFYKRLSFRSIDVTSISLAVQGNSEINGYLKKNEHRALKDAYDSLAEYNHYLEKLSLADK